MFLDNVRKELSLINEKDLDWFFKVLPTDKVTRYPLTNLGIDENGIFHIEIAVAGFDKRDINLEQKGNALHLSGTKEPVENTIKYMQRHISVTPFERSIILHDDYIGGKVDAKVENGICTITVQPKENAKYSIDIK